MTVDASSNGEPSSGRVVEGQWISNGEVQGQPTRKVDHGDESTNWYLEDRITRDPAASEPI